MDKDALIFAGFVAGVGVGILSSRSYFKTKFELKADEEIEAMKKYYQAKEKIETPSKSIIEEQFMIGTHPSDSQEEPSKTLEELKPDLPEYGKMFKNRETVREPYIITPEEFFDEQDGYEKISLSYYELDHILADDDDCMLEDVESAVGQEWENRFGEFVDGIVYVRNEFRQCDYEISAIAAPFTDSD